MTKFKEKCEGKQAYGSIKDKDMNLVVLLPLSVGQVSMLGKIIGDSGMQTEGW